MNRVWHFQFNITNQRRQGQTQNKTGIEVEVQSDLSIPHPSLWIVIMKWILIMLKWKLLGQVS